MSNALAVPGLLAVVQNIAGPFCRHRGLRFVGIGAPGLPAGAGAGAGGAGAGPGEAGADTAERDRILGLFERDHFLRLNAERPEPRGRRSAVAILVLVPGKDLEHHSPDFKKVFDAVLRDERLDEVIVAGSPALFAQKAIAAHVGAVRRARAGALGAEPRDDPRGLAAFVSVYPHSMFALVVPEHVAVYRHTPLTPEEARAFLEGARLEASQLPLIHDNDPPVVWAGGRAGQLVAVDRVSPLGGYERVYRRVVEGPLDRGMA